MFNSKRTRTLKDALSAQNSAMDLMASLVQDLRASSAVNKKVGGVPLNEDDRAKISRIAASMMIARQNIMLALGRREFFNIQPLYPPLDPADAEEFSREVRRFLFPV